MDDDARKMIESILERGFDRMESRFDSLAAELRSHGTEIAVVKVGCARRAVDDEKRDKRISALWQKVGDFKDEISQVAATPKPEPTAVDVVRLMDEREEARSKRLKQWLIWGVPVVVALLGAPQVRSCVGEERAARVEEAVQRLEAKPPSKTIVLPPGPPVPVTIEPDAAPAPTPMKKARKR